MKILFVSLDHLNKSMAGPAQRIWELGNGLASLDCEVVIATPNKTNLESTQLKIVEYRLNNKSDITSLIEDHRPDKVIIQIIRDPLPDLARKHGFELILDAYTPMLVETLEVHKNESLAFQDNLSKILSNEYNYSMSNADAVLVANPRQRDLVLGSLLASSNVNVGLYKEDNSLNNFIRVIPFGLKDEIPKKNGPGFREKLKISEKDTVLYWTGGLWNWFDIITLIKAMSIVKEDRSDVKLVFMGIKTPNDNPVMQMAKDSIQLSKDLGLSDNTVYFNTDAWVAYDELADHLLEADIGISTHFDNLETHYSFRTRILYFLWANMPIISTKGDFFAKEIEINELGITVEPENEELLAKKILELVNNKEKLSLIKENILEYKDSYKWSMVSENLLDLLNAPRPKYNTPLAAKGVKVARNKIAHLLHVIGLLPFIKKILKK